MSEISINIISREDQLGKESILDFLGVKYKLSLIIVITQ